MTVSTRVPLVWMLALTAVIPVADGAAPRPAATPKAAPVQVSFAQSAPTVEVFDFVEVSLNVAQPDAANPFTDVTVAGNFAREGGVPLKVDGFCDAADGSVFCLRFMPAIK